MTESPEQLVHAILLGAVQKGASNIHVEPFEALSRVRYRIGGVLSLERTLPASNRAEVVAELHRLAEVKDVAGRPQAGRIHLVLDAGRAVDFGLSSLPTLWGETIVLRVLDKSQVPLDLEKHGFEPQTLADFRRATRGSWGLVLVVGPTACGKTVTLSAAVSELGSVGASIYSVEDPVAYDLPGINQTSVDASRGLDYASALRVALRQDPDVLMVGDVRDRETAEIAIAAALTGHLVLSALHTNDTSSAISRLLNMGVEPYLITASVSLVLAQRLVRAICAACKEEAPKDPRLLRELGMSEEQVVACKPMKGAGCEACGGTGYKGRLALHELMKMSDGLRELVLQGATAAELKMGALDEGMVTLRRSGNLKILQGTTTVEEVIRVTAAD